METTKETCPYCGSDDLYWDNVSIACRFASLFCRKCERYIREFNV